MQRITRTLLLVSLITIPALAQTSNSDLVQAQQVLALADSAGAQQFAKSIYDDAAYRIRFAQENMASPKAQIKEQARMRAREALFAARAALAKARWAGTNAALRNLQSDIVRFGGRSDLRLADEDPNINFGRGTTTKERIAAAQSAIDLAKNAGAMTSVGDNDLNLAQDSVSSASKVSRNGRDNIEVADHLAYIAEMTARRAYYLARFNETARQLPDLQLQRTRLAQTASETMAATERTQREEAERRAQELQQQLNAQESNRASQAAELERLRSQVDETRRAAAQRMESDRAARREIEARLDEAMSRYEAAVTSGNADSDTLRRQVEDAAIALRAVQERERLNEESMTAEINSLRSGVQAAQNMRPPLDSVVIAQRQADIIRRQNELDLFRNERSQDLMRRTEILRRHEAAISSAQQHRMQADEQVQQMRAQIEAAQQAAQQAAQAAQSAQQQAQAAQQQVESTQQQMQTAQQQSAQQLQTAQQQAAQQLQTVQQLAEKQAAEAEKAREEARKANEELERTRQELARRDAEMRQRQMEAELARLAQTKRESRGFVVTLPGIFFDTGKSQLKAGAKSTLTKIAAQLRNSNTLKVTIEGHTDSTGKAEKNQTLSEERAQAVRDFLVSAGLSGDRITATGKGLAEPVATNKTAAGRQQNRRVELILTD